MTHPTHPSGFRLGIYVYPGVEALEFAGPYGVFAVARRSDPGLGVFLLASSPLPVEAEAGLQVLPKRTLSERPEMDALLVPGGPGAERETENGELHALVASLPETTLLASVGSGSWVYARMGLLDGRAATSRVEGDRNEDCADGLVPIARLVQLAPGCHVRRARVVDAGRIVTAGGIASGVELGLHLLRRAGHNETFVADVARVLGHAGAYDLHRGDLLFERNASGSADS
ncbi:MAG: DJ-1/PfpI family protein [Planctomycetota bacterium]